LPSPEPRLIGSARSALNLDGRERVRALRALGWLIAARVAVRLLGYDNVTRAIARLPASRSSGAAITPAECAIAIRRAARVWPTARCLPQAIAGYCLLRRAGRTPAVKMGVTVEDRRLDAHAWLECDGVTVTGGDVDQRYAPLAPARRRTP
jgi:hypothetical protein